jgi:hypothetical protein
MLHRNIINARSRQLIPEIGAVGARQGPIC